jgi:hypothetical protein
VDPYSKEPWPKLLKLWLLITWCVVLFICDLIAVFDSFKQSLKPLIHSSNHTTLFILNFAHQSFTYALVINVF